MVNKFKLNAGEFLVKVLADPAVDKKVQVREVVYARAGKKKLKADIVTYEGVEPDRFLLYVHGGGFVSGSKKTRTFLCGEFAKHGYLVFNIDYLLAPSADMRAIFGNVGDALRYMETLAESYRIPKRFCIAGDSAGGHIASLLCGALSEPRAREYFDLPESMEPIAMVNICGSFDIQSAYSCEFKEIKTFFKAVTHMNEREILSPLSDLYSPSRYDVSKFPPTFVINAEKDPLRGEGDRLFEALRAAGVACERFTGKGVFAVHCFLLFPYFRESRIGLERCFRFLDALEKNTLEKR